MDRATKKTEVPEHREENRSSRASRPGYGVTTFGDRVLGNRAYIPISTTIGFILVGGMFGLVGGVIGAFVGLIIGMSSLR